MPVLTLGLLPAHADHAPGARRDAGGAAHRLREVRARARHPGADHPLPPRAAQHHDPGDHHRRPAARLGDRLRDRHRKRVPMAGARRAVRPGGPIRRYPGHGRLPDVRRARVRGREPDRRSPLFRRSIRACATPRRRPRGDDGRAALPRHAGTARPVLGFRSRLELSPFAGRDRGQHRGADARARRRARAVARAPQSVRCRDPRPHGGLHAARRAEPGDRARVRARHRQPGPRHSFRHPLRLARLAARRLRVGAVLGRARGHARAGLRLSRRANRCGDHAHRRRAAVVPGDPDRAAGVRRRPRPDRAGAPRARRDRGPHRRHRPVALGAIRAHRARLDPGGEEQGLRAGGARDGPLLVRHHAPATCCRT